MPEAGPGRAAVRHVPGISGGGVGSAWVAVVRGPGVLGAVRGPVVLGAVRGPVVLGSVRGPVVGGSQDEDAWLVAHQ
jgi:hypothetical protein